MSLKNVLLTLLDRRPQSGYEVVKTFDSEVGYFWSASHQQVYRELASLSDAGLVRFKLVRQDDKPDKKIYTITAKGRKSLQAWLEAPLLPKPTKEPLLVKLLNTREGNQELMLAELERALQRSVELRELYASIEARHYSPAQRRDMLPGDIMLHVALRRGMHSIEAHVFWLEETRETLLGLFRKTRLS